MLSTPIGRLRVAGFVEGVSFLLLLFIAMPLKYFAGFPIAVKITGMVHGTLFIFFVFALLQVVMVHRKSILWSFAAFVASIIPFGTFVLDAKLKHEQ
ncbi:DUF3817 domain-containing protein [Xenorhabdus innexi]|uniref:Membrane protein n=1 Tax=Xenorhabdus innexi TaxID=290109 RepID=A0A2G0MKJ1_9GAMM|nr:DUF3817 domain-containing protein [Xenorhabdus innexi]PHM23034.1 membrane protein [Xenorhabdus innexi]